MTDTTSRRRGRPKGSGTLLRTDKPLLEKMADWLLQAPADAPIADAVRAVMRHPNESAIHRLREKFQADRDALMTAAHTRSAPSPRSEALTTTISVQGNFVPVVGNAISSMRRVGSVIEELQRRTNVPELGRVARELRIGQATSELKSVVERSAALTELTRVGDTIKRAMGGEAVMQVLEQQRRIQQMIDPLGLNRRH